MITRRDFLKKFNGVIGLGLAGCVSSDFSGQEPSEKIVAEIRELYNRIMKEYTFSYEFGIISGRVIRDKNSAYLAEAYQYTNGGQELVVGFSRKKFDVFYSDKGLNGIINKGTQVKINPDGRDVYRIVNPNRFRYEYYKAVREMLKMLENGKSELIIYAPKEDFSENRRKNTV